SQNLDFPSFEIVGPQKVGVSNIVRNAAVREGTPAGGCSICKSMERKQHRTLVVCKPSADELALILQGTVSQVTGDGHERQRANANKRAFHLWSSTRAFPGSIVQV